MVVSRRIKAAAIVAALLGLSTPAYSISCATSKCYTDVFNSVDVNELPVLSRVHDIHQSLTKVIGSKKAKRSKLYVIDSPGYPWAIALSDNSIIITKGSIDSMYRENDMDLGDARIAFVIGHELSHLSTDDLFHHRAFVVNQDDTNTQNDWLKSRPDEEIRADLRGYTFATIAGYSTHRLLRGETDFFSGWVSQVGRSNNSTHPDIDSRRRFLEDGFKIILDELPYYKFAISLSYFGHYQDAQYLLEDHLNQVETQAGYTNLGYVHLQRARQLMAPDIAYRYWIPTLLEPTSNLQLKRNRTLFTRSDIPAEAQAHLEIAEQMLKSAIDMDENNLITYINLAAVYLYMPDKLYRAYAAIEDARRTPLGKVAAVREQLESIYQLIRVRDTSDSADRWPNARDTLTKLAESPNAPHNLIYNLARMLDDRGRDDTADQYWLRLHATIESLPRPYQSQVCFRLSIECPIDTASSPWIDSTMPFGKDVRYTDVKKYLATYWNTEAVPAKLLPGLNAKAYTNDKGDSLLALDNHLEMMILRNIPEDLRDFTSLQNEYGPPQVALPVLSGTLVSYGSSWAAYIEDDKVLEIWIQKLDSP